MRVRGLASGLVLIAGMSAWAPSQAALVNLVEVRSNVFEPRAIAIAPGETVTWTARDAGHTVTADDGRFSFPSGGGTLARGDTAAWTFGADETVAYRCLVHGPAMAGVVVVGAGSPPPPPMSEPHHRTVPSPEFPTINAALKGVERNTIIDILPGTYRYEVTVLAPDVTIRGMGSTPEDVVIDGAGLRATGIDVRADDVRIENLSVRGHGIAGIALSRARGFAVEHVSVSAHGAHGVIARASTNGIVREVSVGDAGRTGIEIQDCTACDVVIQRVSVVDSRTGVSIHNAGSVVLMDSSFVRTDLGVALVSEPTREPRAQRGAHVIGNTIRGAGGAAGVWIDGGSHDVVERNLLSGHAYGVVVTGLGGPSFANRIVRNTFGVSAVADLAWDGIGADVCFGRNERADGSNPSTEPLTAEVLYSCDLPRTVGVPWPSVTARMLPT